MLYAGGNECVLPFPSAASLEYAGNVKEIKRANNNLVGMKNLSK